MAVDRARCRAGWVWVAIVAGWVLGWGAVPESRGQGTVTFANNSSTPVIWPATGLPAPSGLFRVGLFYAAPGTPVDPSPVDGYVMAGSPANVINNGLFIGGTRTIPGFEPGALVSLQVRAWSAAFSTYEAAYNAGLSGDFTVCVGHSIVMTLALGGGDLSTPRLVAEGGLQSFMMEYPCPEPSTWMVGLLGALGMAAAGWRRGRRMGAGGHPSQL